jgi:hypothetical protein
MLPSLQLARGIKLVVDAKDAEDAGKILDTPSAAPLSDGIAPSAPQSQRGLPVGPAAFGAGLLLGIAAAMGYKEFQAVRSHDYTYDSDNDGQPDDITHYQHGYAVWRRMDQNFDRKVDYWEYYDKWGGIERCEMDNNFDGKIDGWGTYHLSRLASMKFDTDHNGQVDCTELYNNGLIASRDWSPNGTNIVAVREVYVYGVLSEELRDLDSDGNFDISVRFNPFYQPLSTNYLTRKP